MGYKIRHWQKNFHGDIQVLYIKGKLSCEQQVIADALSNHSVENDLLYILPFHYGFCSGDALQTVNNF
jgi:hypothetical protein